MHPHGPGDSHRTAEKYKGTIDWFVGELAKRGHRGGAAELTRTGLAALWWEAGNRRESESRRMLAALDAETPVLASDVRELVQGRLYNRHPNSEPLPPYDEVAWAGLTRAARTIAKESWAAYRAARATAEAGQDPYVHGWTRENIFWLMVHHGQAHIGEFGSRAAIARTKGELVRGLAPSGTAVLNADDPRVVAMRALTDGPVLTFGRAEHADMRVQDLVLDRLGRATFTLRTSGASAASARVALPLVGAHQALNAAAAAAAGLAAGIPLVTSAVALSTASLSKWRMELRPLACGATLLNDSYNANPDSTRAALDTLAAITGRRRIAVLGAMLELGPDSEAEHRAVGEYAAARADLVAVVGETARPVTAAAGMRAIALTDNRAAVDWLREHLTDGDIVLVKASRGARLDEVAAALG